ncbi:MAG: hypothetical protein AAGI89_09235 [Pseudomonadota bacterium]
MANREVKLATAAALGTGALVETQGSKGSSMLTIFPLLTISLMIYSLLALLPFQGAWYDNALPPIEMISGKPWIITWGDLFLMVSMVFLFVEILRSTETGSDSIWNHGLSAGVFIIAMLMFVLLPAYGNSVFFLYMLMTALDFMAGFIITIRAARRDFGVG